MVHDKELDRYAEDMEEDPALRLVGDQREGYDQDLMETDLNQRGAPIKSGGSSKKKVHPAAKK